MKPSLLLLLFILITEVVISHPLLENPFRDIIAF